MKVHNLKCLGHKEDVSQTLYILTSHDIIPHKFRAAFRRMLGILNKDRHMTNCEYVISSSSLDV